MISSTSQANKNLKYKLRAYLDDNTATANDFPGLSFSVYFTKSSPLTKLLVVFNLIEKGMFNRQVID